MRIFIPKKLNETRKESERQMQFAIRKANKMEKIGRPVLTDFSPHRLASAVEESIAASIPVFGIQGEFRADQPPGVNQAITTIPGGPYNSVAGAKFKPAQADASIEQIIADSRERGACIDWWVGPMTQPADLGSKLAAHGFTLANTIPGMAVDLEKLNVLPAPEGLSVRLARGEAGWRQWTDACLRAWEINAPQLLYVFCVHINDYTGKNWICVQYECRIEQINL